MQKLPKQAYTAAFKDQAVKRVQDGKRVGAVAKERGLVEQTRRNGVKAFDVGTRNGAGAAQVSPEAMALSLSPHMSDRDLVMIGSMIDAIFDHGYYRFIRLHDNHGGLIYGRELTVTIDGVPPWFIAQVPLETPNAEASVMAG